MLPIIFSPSRGAFAVILLANAMAQETQSITNLWHFAPVPASLDATVIGATSSIIDNVVHDAVTYNIDCPASKSPENDECRSLSVYPNRVYHSEGTIYGGTFSRHPGQDITTTWRCELGKCGTSCTATQAQTALCSLTVVFPQAITKIETTTMTNPCEVGLHTIPLAIVGGIESLNPDRATVSYDVSQYISSVDAYLTKIGCEPINTPEKSFSAPFRVSPASTITSASASIPTSTTAITTPVASPVASQDGLATVTSQSTSPTAGSDANGWASRRFGYGVVALCLVLHAVLF